MCDYSLHGVATRPARVGDKLVTAQFWNTTTRGFSAMEEPMVAICFQAPRSLFENNVERHLTGSQLLFKKAGPLPRPMRPLLHLRPLLRLRRLGRTRLLGSRQEKMPR